MAKIHYRRLVLLVALFGMFSALSSSAEAQLFRRRPRQTSYVAPSEDPSVYPMLGTYYPTNYMMVRGNYTGGGGYSPLNFYKDTTMVIYGPLAATRAYTAPVRYNVRGYNGGSYPVRTMAYSYPNLPSLSPVVYPNQGSYYFGFPRPATPPWWQDGNSWIDMN